MVNRHLGQFEGGVPILVSFNAAASLSTAAALYAGFGGEWAAPSATAWRHLGSLAAVSVVSQLLLFRGLARDLPHRVLPWTYLEVPLTVAWGRVRETKQIFRIWRLRIFNEKHKFRIWRTYGANRCVPISRGFFCPGAVRAGPRAAHKKQGLHSTLRICTQGTGWEGW